MWDECIDVNLCRYIEVVKSKEYDVTLEKLEKVYAYDYEVLYFEITHKSVNEMFIHLHLQVS